MSIAAEIWDRYGNLSAKSLPKTVHGFATHSVLDWFGCAIAGSCEPAATLVAEEYADVSGESSLILSTRKMRPQQAALVNGVSGHALDYDDSNPAARFHATSPILPAVLAIGEAEQRTGLGALAALTVGVEVGGRLSALVGADHYARGWHSTATMGILGAVAASSWLYGFDIVRFGNALGLAVSRVAGIRANFGTMAKPFHAGMAAEGGLIAARLARRGMTSNPEAFETSRGLIDLVGDGTPHRGALEALDEEWLTAKTVFKYHAACHGTHAPVEAALALTNGVDVNEIQRLRIRVHPDVMSACRIVYPNSGLEAKFSIRGATAMAVLGIDTADPESFGERWTPPAGLAPLMRRIDVDTLGADRPVTEAVVELETAHSSQSVRIDVGRGDGALPEQETKLRKKFLALAAPRLHGRAAAVADKLLAIGEHPDLRSLIAEVNAAADEGGAPTNRLAAPVETY